jgi:hypothetical protein
MIRRVRARELVADGEPVLSCVEEGLFYADDLPARDPRGYRTLQTYVERRCPDVDRDQWSAAWRLRLVSAREFTEDVFYPVAHRGRFWIVGFNLQFDLSRLAAVVSTSVEYLAGSFSLVLVDYEKNGERTENQWRARLVIKALDSKRQLIGFKRPAELDEVDQIPEEGGLVDDTYTPCGCATCSRTPRGSSIRTRTTRSPRSTGRSRPAGASKTGISGVC